MKEQDTILRAIQETFSAGMVTLIGSGLSAASGLPSMKDLANHLLEHIDDAQFAPGSAEATRWEQIEKRLVNGDALEPALGSDPIPSLLRIAISEQIVRCIDPKEQEAIRRLLSEPLPPPLARLLELVLLKNPIAEVITTNYDRLIEVSATRVRIRVDTQFYGHTIGHLDEKLSREELLKPALSKAGKGELRMVFREHIRLSKPHGSLNWYSTETAPVRSELALDGERLVVAPGTDKYRMLFDTPFQEHLARANKAINNATSFLMIGYGFNDDHLQTQLLKRFRDVPSVLMARTLTAPAHEYLQSNSSSIGLESHRDGGAMAHRGSTTTIFEPPIWELDTFLEEVFQK